MKVTGSKNGGYHRPAVQDPQFRERFVLWWFDDFEFCERLDCREREFISRDRAFVRQFLRTASAHARNMSLMRTLICRRDFAGNVSRMSDQTVIDLIAELLLCGRLHIHAQPARTVLNTGAPPDSATASASAAAAFQPVSVPNRRQQPSVSAAATALIPDVPTFPPNTDLAAQAATLVAAARTGTPACYI